MQALLNDEDEVVFLEPAFDIYPAQVQMAGGISKYVPLRLNVECTEWVLDMAELEAAITPKTKLMVLKYALCNALTLLFLLVNLKSCHSFLCRC